MNCIFYGFLYHGINKSINYPAAYLTCGVMCNRLLASYIRARMQQRGYDIREVSLAHSLTATNKDIPIQPYLCNVRSRYFTHNQRLYNYTHSVSRVKTAHRYS